MLTQTRLNPRLTRRAIRRARVIFVQTDLGIFRVSKREALKVIRTDSHVRAVPVQSFADSLCLGTHLEE